MQIGEVLGSVDCGVTSKDFQSLKLKVVRLYKQGNPDSIIVAGDNNIAPGNGDFVLLERGESVDYTIMGIVDELMPSYINQKISMRIF